MHQALDTFLYERQLTSQGYRWVAGVDEAGRGPLAGPVVAACVVLPVACGHQRFKDSKTLTARARLRLCRELLAMGAAIGIGSVSERGIDRHNILRASLLAMRQAVGMLPRPPHYLLVDGKFEIPSPIPKRALVRGESKSASIAAASIVAKVVRDSMMEYDDACFPQYEFARHKGYPTARHRKLISVYGPCALHRRSFKGVREYLDSVDPAAR